MERGEETHAPRVPWAIVIACLLVAFTSGGVVIELHNLSTDVGDIKLVVGSATANALRLAALETENSSLRHANADLAIRVEANFQEYTRRTAVLEAEDAVLRKSDEALNGRLDAVFVAMTRQGNQPVTRPRSP